MPFESLKTIEVDLEHSNKMHKDQFLKVILTKHVTICHEIKLHDILGILHEKGSVQSAATD